MKDNDPNKKAFEPQIAKQVSWIGDGINISNSTPKLKEAWEKAREMELFYRATDYRGS